MSDVSKQHERLAACAVAIEELGPDVSWEFALITNPYHFFLPPGKKGYSVKLIDVYKGQTLIIWEADVDVSTATHRVIERYKTRVVDIDREGQG